jgi:hypothetical protein
MMFFRVLHFPFKAKFLELAINDATLDMLKFVTAQFLA